MSVKDAAKTRVKVSFLGRWFREKQVVKETGLTTRQRIKRYDAMMTVEKDDRAAMKKGRMEARDGGKTGA